MRTPADDFCDHTREKRFFTTVLPFSHTSAGKSFALGSQSISLQSGLTGEPDLCRCPCRSASTSDRKRAPSLALSSAAIGCVTREETSKKRRYRKGSVPSENVVKPYATK